MVWCAAFAARNTDRIIRPQKPQGRTQSTPAAAAGSEEEKDKLLWCRGLPCLACSQLQAEPVANDPKSAPQISSDSPMLVLVWGAVLLGGIAAFIAWGLSHAYPGA